MAEWWKSIVFSDKNIDDWFYRSALAQACGTRQAMHDLDDTCFVNAVELQRIIEESGCRPVRHLIQRREVSGRDLLATWSTVFASDDSVVILRNYESGEVYCSACSLDAGFITKLQEFLNVNGVMEPTAGEVLVVTKDNTNRYELSHLGRLEHELVRDNYTRPVLSAYDHAVEDLCAADPCGRFVLLDGEPGAGKSFLIRALVSATKALSIFVPSSMTGNLATPELMPVILDRQAKGRPIVLIMEDADTSLIPRATDNLDRISDLLNAADGLLGELIDLRIIATTNADRILLDKALLRPGRLCTHIHLEPLSSEHAEKIYKRLTREQRRYDGPRSLADVYLDARGGRARPVANGIIGFASSPTVGAAPL